MNQRALVEPKNLTVNVHYPRTLLHHLRGSEAAFRGALERARIAPALLADPNARVPMGAYIPLYREATRALGDETFGYLETRTKPGAFAMACDYAANAATVGEALERFRRFYALVTDDLALSLRPAGSAAVAFEVSLRRPELDLHHFVSELFLCIAFRFGSWLAGRTMTLRRARFPYAPPPHADEYMFFFPCPRQFGVGEASAIEFDAAFLALPVLRSAKDVSAYVERSPEDLLTAILSNDSYSNRVYLAIGRRGEQESQVFHDIARDLAMSEQTLRRKLHAEGSSFQAIKDDLRRDTAIFHLLGDSYTVTEISERLGFSTPSGFSRAFKKWTGLSPNAYRCRGEPERGDAGRDEAGRGA